MAIHKPAGSGRLIKPKSDYGQGPNADPARVARYNNEVVNGAEDTFRIKIERMIMPNRFQRERLS